MNRRSALANTNRRTGRMQGLVSTPPRRASTNRIFSPFQDQAATALNTSAAPDMRSTWANRCPQRLGSPRSEDGVPRSCARPANFALQLVYGHYNDHYNG